MPVLAEIEWGKLAELVYVAPLAGLAVCVTFAFVIRFSARAEEARRDGFGAGAIGYGVLTALALAAFAATVVFGISVIVTK